MQSLSAHMKVILSAGRLISLSHWGNPPPHSFLNIRQHLFQHSLMVHICLLRILPLNWLYYLAELFDELNKMFDT